MNLRLHTASRKLVWLLVFGAWCNPASPRAMQAADFTQADAAAALKRAVEFYRTKVGYHGGYGYAVSADLAKREGESKITATQAWMQPPATPAVGMAYLEAYRLTGESYLLDAARETAQCLIESQLVSGGWQNPIESDPVARLAHPYRKNSTPAADAKGKPKREQTTLDDNKTQSCLTFLMRLDAATEFKDAELHEAVLYGLDSLVKVQYPNGAWPQQFEGPSDPAKFPVRKASYPKTWSRTFPKINYTEFYTFNDNTIADVVMLMLEAADTYGESRYRDAAVKAGDFIILAQMPEPQPAWAQQYDAEMHPVWARKFEPPAITGSESQALVKLLLELYRRTGEKKFLEPVPRAVAYLKRSVLPEGGMARFYELHTNKPLYFTKKYELTYDDSDLPTHYGFKVGVGGYDYYQEQYEKLAANGPTEKAPAKKSGAGKLTAAVASAAQQVAGQLDERGAWVEEGTLDHWGENDSTRQIIASKTFIKNLQTLARCAGAK